MASLKRIVTEDGSHSLFSNKFGVSFHSKYGAIQETRHVFIDAGLRLRALTLKKIDVLDIGFGTGLNAYMTLLEAGKKNLKVNYYTIEAFPLELDMAMSLNYPEILGLPETASLFRLLHTSKWDEPVTISKNFQLYKSNSLFQNIAFSSSFDLIYYDAFAPNAQPELWETGQMQKMYDALKIDGVLVTYCAKGVFKRTLRAVGFTVESLPGPPGKREMTRALKV